MDFHRDRALIGVKVEQSTMLNRDFLLRIRIRQEAKSCLDIGQARGNWGCRISCLNQNFQNLGIFRMKANKLKACETAWDVRRILTRYVIGGVFIYKAFNLPATSLIKSMFW